MGDPVRYFFDEHLPNAAATALRARGVDVLTVPEAGRRGFSDDEHLRFATAVGRVMVTHDTDYLALAARFLAAGEPFAGVAFGEAEKYVNDVGGLVRSLLLLHGVMTAAEMLNHVEYL